MFDEIIDFNKAKIDQNNILVVFDEQLIKERVSYGDIKEEDLIALKNKLGDIYRNKLSDHWKYISACKIFSSKDVYLEIGCWPGFIGEYLMKNYDVSFIGVDFNYKRLLTLKKYFDEKGYKKYLLICSDINNIPIKENSVDFVYGGGVIEHLKNTRMILAELFRILKIGGVSYNTVPALSIWWLTRFYNTVPDIALLKNLSEYILLRLFSGYSLKKHHGYQIAFTKRKLIKYHREAGFSDIQTGSFAFYPSDVKIKNKNLRKLVFILRSFSWTAAIYYVHGKK